MYSDGGAANEVQHQPREPFKCPQFTFSQESIGNDRLPKYIRREKEYEAGTKSSPPTVLGTVR